MAADPTDLFEELKRRKVFRATAAYLVVAAGVGAVASDFFPALGLPDWTVTLVVALAILGLPVTIALSWAFDVRPTDRTVESRTGRPPTREADPRSGEPEDSPPTRRRWTAARIGTVAAVAILALAGAAMLLTGDGAVGVVESRVAVLPFENGTGDPSLDDLGVVAADWITDGLTSVPPVQVIPTSTVQQALSSEVGADPIQRVAAATGAGLVVTGSYVLAGDTLEVRAQLVGLPDLEVVGSVEPGRARRSRPTAALGTVREQLMGMVASRLDVYGEVDATGDPPGYEAYRYYLAARDRFGQGRFREAMALFDRATEMEPDFLLPRIWVAGTFWQLSDYPRMDSVLRLLEPYRDRASSLERLMMDGAAAWLQGDLAASYRAGQELFRRYPGSFTRYLAALTALRFNRVHEAIELFEAELEGDPMLDRWIWTHQNLSVALHRVGEYEEELAVAREGRALFGDSPSRVFAEARALAALGRPREVREPLGELVTLSPPGTARWRQVQVGLELRRHGYGESGEQAIRDAVDWFLSQEGPEDSLLPRTAIARARLYLGEPEDAARRFREISSGHPDNLNALGYLGLALAAAGRTGEARDVAARLEGWAEPYLNGSDLYWRATIEARLGGEDRAVALLQEAAARGYSLGWLHEDENLRPLWDRPSFKQLIEPKE